MNLRARVAETEIKQEPDTGTTGRPQGKTRARNSVPVENELVTPAKEGGKESKGKAGTSQVRANKRPASSASSTDSTVPKSKKGRKSSSSGGSVEPVTPPSSSLPTVVNESARTATKAPRVAKDKDKDIAVPKKEPEKETKSQVQTKKEERFSKRTPRERVGGPVTRSLQSSSGEVKNEDPQNKEPGPGE